MKLPNAEHAIVPGPKITHYLLSETHRDGRHKAAFFRSFGFTSEAGRSWPPPCWSTRAPTTWPELCALRSGKTTSWKAR